MSEEIAAWIRKQWGTDKQFYQELERFHKKHDDADYIEYDNETKLPRCAVYRFAPLQVARENFILNSKIANALNEVVSPGGPNKDE